MLRWGAAVAGFAESAHHFRHPVGTDRSQNYQLLLGVVAVFEFGEESANMACMLAVNCGKTYKIMRI